MTPEQQVRGYILMLPGVESGAYQFAGTVRGLRAAGVDRAIDIVEWGRRPFGSLINLTDLPANRKRAVEIASRVVDYRRERPEGPVTVIGFSGGGGMALFVVEALPSDLSLDRVILMAPAVSPDYDLTQVLSRCRRGLVNFRSDGDWATLGMGTSLLGTMDRRYVESAGYKGFQPGAESASGAGGLQEVPWRSAWFWLGHAGGHTGWLSEAWARDVLARYVGETAEVKHQVSSAQRL